MSKKYRWLLVQGTISLWSQSPNVLLEFDAEGSAYCVLSAEDASELAEIITKEARAIWEDSEKLAAVPARVEGNIQRSCKLWTEKGALEAIAHDSEPLIALLFAAGPRCELDVTRAVALVQILQSMAKAVGQKSSLDPPD